MKNEEVLNENELQEVEAEAPEQAEAVTEQEEVQAAESSAKDEAAQQQLEQPEEAKAPEEQPLEPSKDETIATLKMRLLQSEARGVAKEHGVSEKKLPYVVEMAKIGSIDPDSEDAAQLIRAAVEKVLDDIPELKMNVSIGGTGSNGNFARRRSSLDDGEKSVQQEVAAVMRRRH